MILPTHCECCGAYLMGGATIHKPDCPIQKLIEEHFTGGTMVTSLKAQWTVTAGVIPGDVLDVLTKVWHYTSREYEIDCASAVADERSYQENIFTRMTNEAHSYAMKITDPARINWVKVDFMWV